MNEIQVRDVRLLLAAVSGGEAVHLVREHTDIHAGQPAVPDHYFSHPTEFRTAALSVYDQAALRAPRWSDKTLCGRIWVAMVGGDGGPISEYDDPAYAPTCQRCTAIMDKLFPPPVPNEGLALVAQLVADTVIEHGYAEVYGVPGDQQTVLRAEIRRLIRLRINERCTTTVRGDIVYVVCDAVYDQHAVEYSRAAAAAIGKVLFDADDEVTADLPNCHIYWSTWAS